MPRSAAAQALGKLLLPVKVCELSELESKLEYRRRKLGQLRLEGSSKPFCLDRRLTQRYCPSPRATAHKSGRYRQLSRCSLSPFRPSKHALEKSRERVSECDPIGNDLGKDERLRDLLGWPARRDTAFVLAAGKAPRSAPLGAEPIGHSRCGQPREIAEALDAEFRELAATLERQRQEIEWQRLEKELHLAVVDDDRPPGRSHTRSGQRSEAPCRGAYAWLPFRSSCRQGTLERLS